MSFNVLDMFKSNTPAPAPAPAPANLAGASETLPAGATTTPGNIPGITEVNPNNPAGVLNPLEAKKEPDSPMAQYADLWDTVPADPNAAAKDPVGLDPAKLQELVGKANFVGGLSPDTLAAISAGGEGAGVALSEALNSVAQQVMVQSTLANNKLMEQQLSSMQANQTAAVAEIVRQQTTANSIAESNPLFSDPGIRPVIEAVQLQLAEKNPTATPSELTSMAQDFVTAMVSHVTPAEVKPKTDSTRDFSKFLLTS